jgi:DNA-binding XRE family transcriptional regulator
MRSAPSDVETQVGLAVRAFRQRRGLSQSQLAASVGVDRKTINRIENGRHGTKIATLASIAASLGAELSISLDEIDSPSR